jgi:hypothetical protein
VNDQSWPWGSQTVASTGGAAVQRGSQLIEEHGQLWGSQAVPQKERQAGSMPIVQQNQYQFPNQSQKVW